MKPIAATEVLGAQSPSLVSKPHSHQFLSGQNLRKIRVDLLKAALLLIAWIAPMRGIAAVTLLWDASSSSGISGYKLYFGSASRTYTNTLALGNVTSTTVANLTGGITYYFAVTAYDGAGLESAFSNEIIYTAPPASSPPTVALTSPSNGASFTAPANIPFTATVTANGHSITKVQFYNGTTLLGEDTSSPYTHTWNGVCSGSFSFTARCFYDAGSTVNSTPVAVTVANSLPVITVGTLAACYVSETAAGADILARTTATDSCDPPVNTTVARRSSSGPCGVIFTITATDARGASATRDVTVTVDGIAPVITIAPLLDFYPTEAAALADIQTKSSATDNCTAGIVPVATLKSGAGTETLTYTVRATDACGNSASTDVSVSSRPLIARYDFSEGAGNSTADGGPFGLDGLLRGGTSWTTGVAGNAIRFNGSSGYVTVDDDAAFSFGPSVNFSLETWIRTTNNQRTMQVLSKTKSFNKAGFFLLLFNDGHPAIRLRDTDSDTTDYVRHTAGPSLNNGAWHHVVVVFDRSAQTMTLYADGLARSPFNLRTVGANGIGDLTNNEPLLIGGSWYPFDGTIDQVKIHARALSAADVLTNFNARR